MKVLHIDCSVRDGWSVSRELSKVFVSALKEKNSNTAIDYLDIAHDTPSHPTPLFIRGNYALPAERTPEMLEALVESDILVDRMLAANVYVIGMPMYNFSVPSNFKAFIDNVVRINRTFRPADHAFEGLLTDKKVYVINTRGADFSSGVMQAMDQLVPYLKTVFGFMGLTDVTFINVHPVQFVSADAREQAIENAKQEIFRAVQGLINNLSNLNFK